MATVTYQSVTTTVADLQCVTVLPALTSAMNWSGWAATSCSASPVQVGTSVTFTNAGGTPYSQLITAVSSASASTSASTAASACAAELPFDYAYASGIWGLAFTSVLILYVVSLHVGAILNLIRGR